jgi:hypothetical protein
MAFLRPTEAFARKTCKLGDFEELKRVTPRYCDAVIERHEHKGDFKEP